jgi:hypothetical protein
MAYYIFLKSLKSLEEFRKNPHVKNTPKSPSTNFPRDHYKVVQWFSLVCIIRSVPAEVSSEVSVQITKGPLLRYVVLWRVHSLTHSFPTRRIPRESTQSAHGCTIFMGGRSMNRSLDLGMMSTTGFRSPPDKAPNCLNPSNADSNPSPQIPILHINREQQQLTG